MWTFGIKIVREKNFWTCVEFHLSVNHRLFLNVIPIEDFSLGCLVCESDYKARDRESCSSDLLDIWQVCCRGPKGVQSSILCILDTWHDRYDCILNKQLQWLKRSGTSEAHHVISRWSRCKWRSGLELSFFPAIVKTCQVLSSFRRKHFECASVSNMWQYQCHFYAHTPEKHSVHTACLHLLFCCDMWYFMSSWRASWWFSLGAEIMLCFTA